MAKSIIALIAPVRRWNARWVMTGFRGVPGEGKTARRVPGRVGLLACSGNRRRDRLFVPDDGLVLLLLPLLGRIASRTPRWRVGVPRGARQAEGVVARQIAAGRRRA